MGVSHSYWRIKEEDLRRVLLDTSYGEKFIEGVTTEEFQYYESIGDESTVGNIIESHREAIMNSDKFIWTGHWQAIHFLLTDEYCTVGKSKVKPPICNIVMGGKETPYTNFGCPGNIRYLTSQEVKEVTNYLINIQFDSLRDKYEFEVYNYYGFQPHHNRWTENSVDELLSDLKKVIEFFDVAAKYQEAILITRHTYY
ncbi:MAG: DUF1877 family protein [Acidobacteriota bacterium]